MLVASIKLNLLFFFFLFALISVFDTFQTYEETSMEICKVPECGGD